MSTRPWLVLALLGAFAWGLAMRAEPAPPPVPLVTGRTLARLEGVGVGSFPAQMVSSPDGRWIAVVSVGRRQALSIIDAADGHLASAVPAASGEAFYAGLAWAPDGRLYVSRGGMDEVGVYEVDARGQLQRDAPIRVPPVRGSAFVAGLAVDGDLLYAVHNECTPATGWQGAVSALRRSTGKIVWTCPAPAFPYAVCAIGGRVYVTSERDGVVAVMERGSLVGTIRVGDHPVALVASPDGRRLYVANASSDSISVVDVGSGRVDATIGLRPGPVRQLPGLTPTGLALAGSTLYVALSDFNAIALVDVSRGNVRGYLPTGWYPTSVVARGDFLYVSNGKGNRVRTPNDRPLGPGGAWGQHPLGILEGTVSRIPRPGSADLGALTEAALQHGRVRSGGTLTQAPAIRHVIYVVKENRAYDQVLGDLPKGNGDARLVMFGRDVTPNQHALADRFVLLDDFYCCAEVSADGWNWSTAGMASEYTSRNVPYYYGHKGRNYDFEGSTNGVPVDLQHIPDVASPPGGYLWDLAERHGVVVRNFGMFETDTDDEGVTPGSKDRNIADRRALEGRTDENYRRFDLDYADSDAWVRLGFQAPKQRLAYGANKAPSRIAEFKHEFDGWCASGRMPALVLMRLPRDHTYGTRKKQPAPRAMVADNDYAVGQLVDMVSHSRFWKETAIFVVEDDAQNGYDHVDCHRSTAYVVSPWVPRGRVDHGFHNTDSVLRTMELLLELPPMNQFDALAPPLDVFGDVPSNVEPYRAVLPAREVLTEMNGETGYRSDECEQFDWSEADRVPDEALTEIVWQAVMKRPPPGRTVVESRR